MSGKYIIGPFLALLLTTLLIALLAASCTTGQDAVELEEQNEHEEWIVFSSGRTGNGDIYAARPDSSVSIRIAGSEAAEGAVRYNPFKKQIVYTRFGDAPAPSVLVAGNDDLFEDPNGDVAPAWSPVKNEVVYVAARDGKENIYLARGDGSGERQLTNTAFTDRYPSWSPDGTSIVFARRVENGWDLFTLDIETAEEQQITKRETYVGHPAWSPDGRNIAFDTFFDDQAEIAMLNLDSGEITRLTNRAGNDLIPGWSGDSRRIAFGADPGNAGNWDIWTVDVETLELTQITSADSYEGGPVFVPADVIRAALHYTN